MAKIDYSYAFGRPWAMGMCLPSASEKFIMHVYEEHLYFAYSERDLRDTDLLTFAQLPMDRKMNVYFMENGKAMPIREVHRSETGAPVLFCKAGDKVQYSVRSGAVKGGLYTQVEVTGEGTATVCVEHKGGWVLSNWGWYEDGRENYLLTMNDNRPDKVLCYVRGADSYPLDRTGDGLGQVPMPDSETDRILPAKCVTAQMTLQKGETRVCELFMPFKMFTEDAETIENTDFAALEKKAMSAWKRILNKGAKLSFGDKKLESAYRACLADLFVMREKLQKGYTGISCGTRVYRSVNSGEPTIACGVLDQLGYPEGMDSARVCFEAQEKDGCWAYRKGWEHEGWGVTAFKSAIAMQHYALYRDREFLEAIYPRMLASTRFNGQARKKQNDPDSPYYGLMPKGMGDCGMMNHDDYYGYFYPWNAASVQSDGDTLKAAEILEKPEVEEVRAIYNEGKANLIRSVRKYAVQEDGYRWIPNMAAVPNSCFYGAVMMAWPCQILPYDDELILGTQHHIEKNGISKGGLPIGTGWLKDGLWVAMALNDFSSLYLRQGQYEKAAAFLYPTVNHATPLTTWCEERGVEKGSLVTSGDEQHLWTPVALCRYILDALAFEDEKGLHLFAGIPEEWYRRKNVAGAKGLYTVNGKSDLSLTNANGKIIVDASFERMDQKTVYLHYISNGKRLEKCIQLTGHTLHVEIEKTE